MTGGGRLDGKIAIITGAASGIGKATARRVAAEGARTVVADINGAGAKEVADAITAAGGEAIPVEVDLGDNDSVRAMVGAAVAAYGGLDILHNNAADRAAERLYWLRSRIRQGTGAAARQWPAPRFAPPG